MSLRPPDRYADLGEAHCCARSARRHSRPKSPIRSARRYRIMPDHQGACVIEQQLLGRVAELGKGTFQPFEPSSLAARSGTPGYDADTNRPDKGPRVYSTGKMRPNSNG